MKLDAGQPNTMKHAESIHTQDPEEERLRQFDLREIDAPDQRTHFALKYIARLDAVMRVVREGTPEGGLILEAGCAQANTGILLAEEGYRVIGMDLLPGALTYARKKRERGEFLPVAGDADAPPFAEGFCDAIIAGEMIEHCARPVQVLGGLASLLKPGGMMVVTTTPNASRFRADGPKYALAVADDLEGRQFGRGGEDHLFEFTLDELAGVVRDAGLEVRRTERHASMLHSDRLGAFRWLIPPAQVRSLSSFLCNLPIVGPLTALTLLIVGVRPRE